MKHQKNLKERYIQLVETFITALESGKSGTELEDIRNEIRNISSQLTPSHSVENPTQMFDFLPFREKNDENENRLV
jgi:hypothetical protein